MARREAMEILFIYMIVVNDVCRLVEQRPNFVFVCLLDLSTDDANSRMSTNVFTHDLRLPLKRLTQRLTERCRLFDVR
jgi:hypothetical protein